MTIPYRDLDNCIHIKPALIEVGLLSRCRQKVHRRKNLLHGLRLSLESAKEIESVYWEQVHKLSEPTIRASFRSYARRFTKDRKKLEKAIRSRGGET